MADESTGQAARSRDGANGKSWFARQQASFQTAGIERVRASRAALSPMPYEGLEVDVQFQEKVTIQRPLDEVFAYMSNAENDAEWRTNVKQINRVSEGSASGVGTVYRQVIRGPFGRDLDADLRYTDYEANRRLAFDTISGAIRPSAVIEFSPASEHATEVRFQMTWEPEGGMRLAAPLVGRMLGRSIHESYANLVRHLEGAANA